MEGRECGRERATFRPYYAEWMGRPPRESGNVHVDVRSRSWAPWPDELERYAASFGGECFDSDAREAVRGADVVVYDARDAEHVLEDPKREHNLQPWMLWQRVNLQMHVDG